MPLDEKATKRIAGLTGIALLALLCLAPSAAAGLPEKLRRLVDGKGISAASLWMARIGGAKPIISWNSDDPRIPASTAKLVTTACALAQLGPSHVFRTELLADARPSADGRINGPLYVRGRGDPLLRAEDLWVVVRDLAAIGVREIRGPLIADDGWLETPGRPSSWPPQSSRAPYYAPQGGLSLAWNSLEVIAVAGARVGTPGIVTTFPLKSAVPIENTLVTSTRTNVLVNFEDDPEGPGTIRVSGTISRNGGVWRRWFHLGHPTWVTASAVAGLLEEEGIELRGEVKPGRVPDAAVVLAKRESQPLTTLVHAVNKFSSNSGAETLLRGLAAEAGETPGTTEAGLRHVDDCLDDWAVPEGTIRLVDGSGFGRKNRVTARGLAALLERAMAEPEWGFELIASLPRGGEDGTLERRLRESNALVRAKTGYLAGVAALAGYLWTPDGGLPYSFVILLEGGAAGPRAVDRILRQMIELAIRDAR